MLTRAAVFCAHQSVHTLAQSRDATLNYDSIQFWSGDNPVMVSDGSEGQVRVVLESVTATASGTVPGPRLSSPRQKSHFH